MDDFNNNGFDPLDSEKDKQNSANPYEQQSQQNSYGQQPYGMPPSNQEQQPYNANQQYGQQPYNPNQQPYNPNQQYGQQPYNPNPQYGQQPYNPNQQYGQQPYNPNPQYNQQYYYNQMPPESKGKSIASMILGIVSIFVSCFTPLMIAVVKMETNPDTTWAGMIVPAIIIILSLVLGIKFLSEKHRSGNAFSIVGIVTSSLSILMALYLVFFLVTQWDLFVESYESSSSSMNVRAPYSSYIE